MLERLLAKSAGLFDDLVVVHDGAEDEDEESSSHPTWPPAIDYHSLTPGTSVPDYRTPPSPARSHSIHELTLRYGGKFFEGPRAYQQEPHWPFAWSQARHDWILRLDADEFPSDELKEWLIRFREMEKIDPAISGYTCIWPLWDGRREITHCWPGGRIFLFCREQVRFFGMVEQVPTPDNSYESLDLRLCHQPRRKSHGLANILIRRQGRFWREVIAESLLRETTSLPRWRWDLPEWPPIWRRMRGRPLRTQIYFLLRDTVSSLIAHWRQERKLMPLIALATPLHHFLIYLRLQRKRKDAAGQK
jgi:hypothetical protein